MGGRVGLTRARRPLNNEIAVVHSCNGIHRPSQQGGALRDDSLAGGVTLEPWELSLDEVNEGEISRRVSRQNTLCERNHSSDQDVLLYKSTGDQ